MQTDREQKANVNTLLVLGYIKNETHSNNLKLLTLADIIDLISLFLSQQSMYIQLPTPMEIINEPSQCMAKEAIEPTILLIAGYIRQNSVQLNFGMTSIMCDLCEQFYQRMKGTLFIWNINNAKSRLLSQILSTNNTDTHSSFDSHIFSIQPRLEHSNTNSQSELSICGHCNSNTAAMANRHSSKVMSVCKHCNDIKNVSLQYYLKLMPHSTNNAMQLRISLVSLPSMIKSVSFIYQIYCPQLCLYYSAQKKYNIDVLSSVCVNHWKSLVAIDDIKQLYQSNRINSLTFLCKLDIVDIDINRSKVQSIQQKFHSQSNPKVLINYKFNPTYHFDAKRYFENKNKNKLLHTFKWCINDVSLAHFKNSQLPNQSMISDIFYDMWALSVRHRKIDLIDRGVSTDAINSNTSDALSIAVQLSVLPPNVSKIVAQIELVCSQSKIQWSTVHTFSKNHQTYAPNGDIIIRDKYINLSQLSVVCNISVREVYDVSGKEMCAQIEKEQSAKNREPMSTMGLLICWKQSFGDVYQHICVLNCNKFDEVSVEELQAHDRMMHPEKFQKKVEISFPSLPTPTMDGIDDGIRTMENENNANIFNFSEANEVMHIYKTRINRMHKTYGAKLGHIIGHKMRRENLKIVLSDIEKNKGSTEKMHSLYVSECKKYNIRPQSMPTPQKKAKASENNSNSQWNVGNQWFNDKSDNNPTMTSWSFGGTNSVWGNSEHCKIGTKEHKFHPFQDRHHRLNKTYYYQNICVGHRRFDSKCCEELRFEDQFQIKADVVPLTSAVTPKKGAKNSGVWTWGGPKTDSKAKTLTWNNGESKSNFAEREKEKSSSSSQWNFGNSTTNATSMWSFGDTTNEKSTNKDSSPNITMEDTNAINMNEKSASLNESEVLRKSKKLYKGYFKDLYSKYAPQKIGNVENLMTKYSSSPKQLQTLYERLISKYCVKSEDIKPMLSAQQLRDMTFDDAVDSIQKQITEIEGKLSEIERLEQKRKASEKLSADEMSKFENKKDLTLSLTKLKAVKNGKSAEINDKNGASESDQKKETNECGKKDLESETKLESETNEMNKAFNEWYWHKIGIDKYYSLFVGNGLNDLQILDRLTDENLREIGIMQMGDRIKILKEIEHKRLEIKSANSETNNNFWSKYKDKLIIFFVVLQFMGWVLLLFSKQ